MTTSSCAQQHGFIGHLEEKNILCPEQHGFMGHLDDNNILCPQQQGFMGHPDDNILCPQQHGFMGHPDDNILCPQQHGFMGHTGNNILCPEQHGFMGHPDDNILCPQQHCFMGLPDDNILCPQQHCFMGHPEDNSILCPQQHGFMGHLEENNILCPQQHCFMGHPYDNILCPQQHCFMGHPYDNILCPQQHCFMGHPDDNILCPQQHCFMGHPDDNILCPQQHCFMGHPDDNNILCPATRLQTITSPFVLPPGRAFVRLCYFSSWAYSRASVYTRFDVQHINPSLCTHLVYAFANIDPDSRSLIPMDAQDDPQPGSVGRYNRFNDLKKHYPHLRTLVSVGGQYAGSRQFAHIASNPHYLQTFAQTTVQFLRKRNFDGLDIDWEYPNATTKFDYTKLLKALRAAFEADHSGRERLLLTVALPVGRHVIDPGYDISAVNRYVDLANVMTYDYHGAWNNMTSFDSPLRSRKSDPNFNNELSTEWTINYYMSKGLAANKILVGVTAAGTRFKLQNPALTGVGAPVITADYPRVSDLWQLQDRYAYPEICQILQSPLAHRVFDEEQQVPYVYKGDDWFGYEDVQSLQGKVDWMIKKGVAGAMFWALDMDDFTGKICDSGTFPLLRALSHSVGQIEGPHLTDNVNPSIRYLTKYTGRGGASGILTRAGIASYWGTVVAGMFVVVMVNMLS
ncbi:hypothetical protein ACOMHN_004945 [Nucella lapillus]